MESTQRVDAVQPYRPRAHVGSRFPACGAEGSVLVLRSEKAETKVSCPSRRTPAGLGRQGWLLPDGQEGASGRPSSQGKGDPLVGPALGLGGVGHGCRPAWEGALHTSLNGHRAMGRWGYVCGPWREHQGRHVCGPCFALDTEPPPPATAQVRADAVPATGAPQV